jgi:hypothetical protein
MQADAAEPTAPRQPLPPPAAQDSAGADDCVVHAGSPEPDTAAAAEPEPGPTARATESANVDAEHGGAAEAAAVPNSGPNPDSGPNPSPVPAQAPAPAPAQALPAAQTPTRVNPITGRGERPAGMTTGIGCTALLLPVFAVASALACFAAGVWSTSTGCTPDGSALCSSAGPWFTFALPLFVAPLVAAVTATGAVVVKRHRSTWLAVGYAVVFISLVVGLVSANTGAS